MSDNRQPLNSIRIKAMDRTDEHETTKCFKSKTSPRDPQTAAIARRLRLGAFVGLQVVRCNHT